MTWTLEQDHTHHILPCTSTCAQIAPSCTVPSPAYHAAPWAAPSQGARIRTSRPGLRASSVAMATLGRACHVGIQQRFSLRRPYFKHHTHLVPSSGNAKTSFALRFTPRSDKLPRDSVLGSHLPIDSRTSPARNTIQSRSLTRPTLCASSATTIRARPTSSAAQKRRRRRAAR